MTEQKCVDTIRMLSADMVEKAKSGHPGAPMGCAPLAHVLWSDAMTYNPANPKWWNRDRFVLSNGTSKRAPNDEWRRIPRIYSHWRPLLQTICIY